MIEALSARHAPAGRLSTKRFFAGTSYLRTLRDAEAKNRRLTQSLAATALLLCLAGPAWADGAGGANSAILGGNGISGGAGGGTGGKGGGGGDGFNGDSLSGVSGPIMGGKGGDGDTPTDENRPAVAVAVARARC
ncbi:MAG: hypothetical protein FWD79_06995 [Desulfobulbus sp.]|nr:hypothetical protein [Desulfobulbus sp.]